MKYPVRFIAATLALCIAGCDVTKSKAPTVGAWTLDTLQHTAAASNPFLFSGADGSTMVSWVEKFADSNSLHLATLGVSGLQHIREIVRGDEWFHNWADFPSIAKNGNTIATHYLKKRTKGTYDYDVHVLLSQDEGKTWQPSFVLHGDSVAAEHGFVSITPSGEGFFMSWLDGRNTKMHTAGGGKEEGHDAHHGGGAMSLRGAYLNKLGQKTSEWELDNRVCDCCQTSAVHTPSGPVVIYRDRSLTEVRDMSLLRHTQSGWTRPKPLMRQNFVIKGCPVNGPKLASRGNQLAATWFSTPEQNPELHIVFSHDAGETLGKPIKLAEGENLIGRVSTTWINDKWAAVSFIDDGKLKLVFANVDGEKSSPVVVSETNTSRAGGFPQLTFYHNELVLAWTDVEHKRIAVARAKIEE